MSLTVTSSTPIGEQQLQPKKMQEEMWKAKQTMWNARQAEHYNLNRQIIASIEPLVESRQGWPKEKIIFQDVSGIYADPEASQKLGELTVGAVKKTENANGREFDLVVALAARGFIEGIRVADALKKPLVWVRKKGKLPPIGEDGKKTGKYGEKILASQEHGLEYGKDIAQISVTRFLKIAMEKARAHVNGDLIFDKRIYAVGVDELLATGGTMDAVTKLFDKVNKELAKVGKSLVKSARTEVDIKVGKLIEETKASVGLFVTTVEVEKDILKGRKRLENFGAGTQVLNIIKVT